ncbi:NADP-specific glutamate dehydrogenase [Elizabethkingia sp. JS20170427COW]|uniref:NADP-specific glutamate dehydrogenase n=1 Tax=Elizabethkingia sp. JS20170427COW TaxID=2583851 RepID=UPI001110E3F0|nr:NADP-specific glutamate dehydrogenase [Elizabethkingia sp. JS20170427COW]QCX53251.1 NADP-specific glutamate dehydrogenase [Elizabethkingia sp. JS20170427COW]
MSTKLNLQDFIEKVKRENPNEPQFHQAVHEVAEILIPYINEHPQYLENKVLERLVEPERVIQFKVTWEDDNGEIQINKGYRIQMNSCIGPYKGGLRFHPSVNLGILKFLAFEQVFKNSLTTLPMGGGKGGSNFDPKGKSDREIMRFCKAFMEELYKHIDENTDVPAGDIGVGGREIGYLFGHYKKLRSKFTGVLTGKGLGFGGSLIRPEATGYGLLYFVECMLKEKNESIVGKTVSISGSGNVSLYAAEKCIELGAKVLTLSDSSGYIYDPEGIDAEKLKTVFKIKLEDYARISEYIQYYPHATFVAGKRPWEVKCDIALPNACENELDLSDAQKLHANGCILVAEGANMPSTPEAVHFFLDNGILYGLGKAANAGGVATSGLEMSQNSLRLNWTREEVDQRLKRIMQDIHEQCKQYGGSIHNNINYYKGANIAGFVKVADALIAQGF